MPNGCSDCISSAGKLALGRSHWRRPSLCRRARGDAVGHSSDPVCLRTNIGDLGLCGTCHEQPLLTCVGGRKSAFSRIKGNIWPPDRVWYSHGMSIPDFPIFGQIGDRGFPDSRFWPNREIRDLPRFPIPGQIGTGGNGNWGFPGLALSTPMRAESNHKTGTETGGRGPGPGGCQARRRRGLRGSASCSRLLQYPRG